jgi:hypothetical protein
MYMFSHKAQNFSIGNDHQPTLLITVIIDRCLCCVTQLHIPFTFIQFHWSDGAVATDRLR